MLIKDIRDCRAFPAIDETTIRELLHPVETGMAIACSVAHATLEPCKSSRSHRLKTSETRIGRSALCDVVLQDSLVSRVHCLLRRSAKGGLTLEDLNSANGTSVNGERIDHARLKPGDLIVMGKTEIVVASLTQSHQEDESETLTVARPPTRPSVRAG